MLRWIAPFCMSAVLVAGLGMVAQGQGFKAHSEQIADQELDPVRQMGAQRLESATHKPLAEEYIWTSEDAVPQHPTFEGGWLSGGEKNLGQHYFRRTFEVREAPAAATLYVAGPRAATMFLNGEKVGGYELNLDAPLGIRVYAVDVTHALRAGKNVLAIAAVRGPSIGSGADSRLSVQQTRGQVLVAKIVPTAQGVVAAPLVITDATWKASMIGPEGWSGMAFNDGDWKAADSLGGVESSIEFLQWNADAGMYDWPGYEGISPFLAQYALKPVKVTHVSAGLGQFGDFEGLKAAGAFTVKLPPGGVGAGAAPQVMLDFGREVVGRLEVRSDSDKSSDVTVQYGESEAEVLNEPYLGVDPLHVAAHGTAYGPKSAFRYAVVRFTGGAETRYAGMQLAGIEYPVTYKGSFESSDAALNKMWAIGAYTAHLCMQDDIWDAPKRDRGRWMGDLDVSGRTIEDAFDDHFLMDETLDRLLGEAPVKKHVNGIAGYSAFWIMGEAEYFKHTGSMQQLESTHDRLVQLMHYMETELDERNLFANETKAWPFVDWSPELNGTGAESLRGTQFEFYAGFRDGVYLLRQMHDTKNADLFQKRADAMKAAAQKYLLDGTGSFGDRWQTNAFAVLSGTANASQYGAIWKNSLASVGHVKYNALIVTPYYNYYVISAMAKMDHRKEALDWIRQYWGGMVDEGATSFWEGYDPSWYRGNFHASLQADDMSGYRVSLAHGWSSGVTPWLMEEVLGIHATGKGFETVEIRPDLLDLEWAKGAEPTPRGLLGVDVKKAGAGYTTVIELPAGTEARVSVPGTGRVMVNGKAAAAAPGKERGRSVVVLKTAGQYSIESGS